MAEISDPPTRGSGLTGEGEGDAEVGGSTGTGGSDDLGGGGSAVASGSGGQVTGSGGASSSTGGATGQGNDPGGGGSTQASAPYCTVRQMITSRCVSCHANPPVAGAPMSLVNYVDLLVAAQSAPTRMVGEVALDRIQNNSRPMPPAPAARASAAEVQALQDWLNAGTPQSRCTTTPPPTTGAGGAGGGAGAVDAGRDAAPDARADARPPVVVDAGRADATATTPPPTTDPFAGPSVCTSNVRWTGGNNANMRPGESCLNCHGNYRIAGTVFPTAHEPNDCNGQNGGAVVVITDANGTVRNLTVNSVGNFEFNGTVATPFRAKVTYQGRERAMSAAQTNGSCNSCHTQNGSGGAPGRILLP